MKELLLYKSFYVFWHTFIILIFCLISYVSISSISEIVARQTTLKDWITN